MDYRTLLALSFELFVEIFEYYIIKKKGFYKKSNFKLDAGVNETIQLVSRDGENILIVSYAELRNCLDNSFGVLVSPEVNNPSIVSSTNKPEKNL